MVEARGNAALGVGALGHILTGENNVAMGHQSLQFMHDGSNATSISNCTGVGFNTRCSGVNQLQLGNQFQTCYVYGAIQNRSDPRDKADVRETTLGLDFILSLQAVDYIWDMRDDYIETVTEADGSVKIVRHDKDGRSKRNRFHHGFLATQVKEAAQELGCDFGGYQDHSINGGSDVLTLGYEEFIAPLAKAVQELHSRLSLLEEQQAVQG